MRLFLASLPWHHLSVSLTQSQLPGPEVLVVADFMAAAVVSAAAVAVLAVGVTEEVPEVVATAETVALAVVVALTRDQGILAAGVPTVVGFPIMEVAPMFPADSMTTLDLIQILRIRLAPLIGPAEAILVG